LNANYLAPIDWAASRVIVADLLQNAPGMREANRGFRSILAALTRITRISDPCVVRLPPWPSPC
jgi:hypothetical protein